MIPYRKALSILISMVLAAGLCPSLAFADMSADGSAETELQVAPELEAAAVTDGVGVAIEPESESENAAELETVAEPETESAIEVEEAEAEESEGAEEVAEQRCGDDLEWSVDEYGTLTIIGTGAMWDFNEDHPAPWADQAASITSLVIEDGATSIGSNAFNCLCALESVQLPESIAEVPEGAFDGTPYQAAIDEAAAAAEAEQQAAEETDAANEAEAVEPETETVETETEAAEAEEATEPEAVESEVAAEEVPEAAEPEESAEDEVELAPVASGKDSAGTSDEDDLELTAQAATSGKCGTNLKWSYSSGTLTISGTGSMGGYRYDPPWSAFRSSITKVVISSGVTTIGNYAFNGCEKLASVSIPNTVNTIGEWAFCGCYSLRSVTIPNSVTNILQFAFECSGLRSVVIPNSVITIGPLAFEACPYLTSVSIGNSVSTIGDHAFNGCGGRTSSPCSVKFGKNSVLNSVGVGSFYPCRVYAYKGTTAYRTLTFEGGVKVIDRYISLSKAAVSLSYSRTTYNGSAKKPAATVTLNGKQLASGTDYTVSYSNNTKVGTATVKVTGKGKYSGSVSKTFKINPKGTSIAKLTPGSACMTVKWYKQATQTSGYQVRYSRYSDMSNSKTAIVSGTSTVSKKLTGLYKGKRYYVQVRTYKTVNGTRYYSAWSTKKYATVK